MSNRIKLTVISIALIVASAASAAPARAETQMLTGKPLEMVTALYNDLNLTPEQIEAIKVILQSHQAELATLTVAEATARRQKVEAIQQPTVDESAVRAAAAAVAAVDVIVNLERAEIFSEIAAVLTDQQIDTIEEFVAKVESQIANRERTLVLPQRQVNGMVLTPEQKEQIKAILQTHKPAVEALLAQEKAARTVLLEAIHQPSVDAPAVRDASAAVADVDAGLDVERAHIYAEIHAVLTPEQIAALEARLARIEAQIQARIEALLALFGQLL
jgi:Spy/CpxP family protein refolding chaperone